MRTKSPNETTMEVLGAFCGGEQRPPSQALCTYASFYASFCTFCSRDVPQRDFYSALTVFIVGVAGAHWWRSPATVFRPSPIKETKLCPVRRSTHLSYDHPKSPTFSQAGTTNRPPQTWIPIIRSLLDSPLEPQQENAPAAASSQICCPWPKGYGPNAELTLDC